MKPGTARHPQQQSAGTQPYGEERIIDGLNDGFIVKIIV